ncbi:hypothetical protein FHT77_004527 [Rhizobium sp. BK181]|nr:hypothetical protein [Rhizobium sp. BK181]MBB3318626.1 hypothetical protein [Rhizobium sp. BK181]
MENKSPSNRWRLQIMLDASTLHVITELEASVDILKKHVPKGEK